MPTSNSFSGKAQAGTPTGSAVLSDIAALRYGYQYEYKKAKEKTDLNFTNNIELQVYLRYEDESLVTALKFDNIHERYFSGNFKYVIGKTNLQNLIDNQQLIANDKAFVAFAGQLAGVTLASEAKLAEAAL